MSLYICSIYVTRLCVVMPAVFTGSSVTLRLGYSHYTPATLETPVRSAAILVTLWGGRGGHVFPPALITFMVNLLL